METKGVCIAVVPLLNGVFETDVAAAYASLLLCCKFSPCTPERTSHCIHYGGNRYVCLLLLSLSLFTTHFYLYLHCVCLFILFIWWKGSFFLIHSQIYDPVTEHLPKIYFTIVIFKFSQLFFSFVKWDLMAQEEKVFAAAG